MVNALFAVVMHQTVGRWDDTDRDGLLDAWETQGFGPLDPKTHGCDPNRPDLVLVLRPRSAVTKEKLAPVVARIAKFYAELPRKNADGSTGIHLIPIVLDPMPKDTDGVSYINLYDKAMPAEWRGLAHGVLVDDNPGGGGQANRPDWCGTGYNWMTIVHEVGHQLGLPHHPMSGGTGSPFHPSLMNYDYSYQLGGNGDKIQYSPGRFASLRMKETNLEETLPFPLAELAFLAARPYFFKLKELAPGSTAVDWNRNGVFGESHVRADINDGYSAGTSRYIQVGKAAGAPSVVSVQGRLSVVFPELQDPKEYGSFTDASLSVAKPGKLSIVTLVNGKPGPVQTLVARGVVGDPSVAPNENGFNVAVPMADGWRVYGFEPAGKEWKLARCEPDAPSTYDVTLCRTKAGFVSAYVDRQSGQVLLGSPGRARKELAGVFSLTGVGLAWNSKKSLLAVATAERGPERKGRVRIREFSQAGGRWQQTSDMWVEGEKGGFATFSKPNLVYDPTPSRGPEGGYSVFVKGAYEKPNHPGLEFVSRQIADKERSDGWRSKMIVNEWNTSRSVCGVAPHNGDIAYAVRATGYAAESTLFVAVQASGVESAWVTDFDEVGFILQHGLADSLREVQAEQWRKNR